MLTTTPKPVDFSKVESLRKHMLLTKTDMAGLLGVSRMTYYAWVEGRGARLKNQEHIRTMLKRLLVVMSEHGWPTPDVIAASQPERKQMLLEILER